ncbi:hypothetical protein LIP69_19495, partial [Erysipelatoclostridium ramosum]|nr:hypothetical protein [Thomasclavelia ramosa]
PIYMARLKQLASPGSQALVMKNQLKHTIVTGRDSPAVRRRVADLDLQHAVYGARDKLAAAEPLLSALGASWDEVAVMGDD